MRRSDREVTDRSEILDIIRRCDVCRIALNDGDYPYILPLNFGMETDGGVVVLYFHGAAQGRKYDIIARDNRASFEMDCSHRLVTRLERKSCTMEYESVIGRGRIEIVEGDKKLAALKLLNAHYGADNLEIGEAVAQRTVVMKLTVEDMTAKRRMVKQD